MSVANSIPVSLPISSMYIFVWPMTLPSSAYSKGGQSVSMPTVTTGFDSSHLFSAPSSLYSKIVLARMSLYDS